ncbi:HAD family hydrolase [Methylotuvimicrobium alcaliphilum]|uniref:HAD-superfamily hydrolase, subfamily IA, variant 3 n=1 Tax=Methylotuvimicrobium alcaliphilum (strain DSM 19304 / NCIMB 14124 / VKM B-2133 / 20Z) TaxID=1091494 RepID=G4SW65_META2|nr:HAD family phosphatase [Methylotuvimicrobium alcaliphilum]CCE22980.1 HAD-superfamily hydrolase, subfamily IA, variant 3 [Methylotuvimicrobium alcaliphilum 20Z]
MVNGEADAVRQALRAVEGAIFDLDGLVLDTESTYFMAWRQAAEHMGYQLPSAFCLSLSGLHYRDVEMRLLEFCGNAFDLQEFNRLSGVCWYRIVEKQGIDIKKGFLTLLWLLQDSGIPYGLATNSRLNNALECLDFAGLGNVFETIVARDHVELGKPAPDIFLNAAERLSIPISRCLALEDSTAGVMAASASGAFTVYIPSVLPADLYTSELSHLQCRDLGEVAALWAARDL